MLPDYEKLGAFYLGRETAGGRTLLYDSKDLVTHAVCVGMTGSGKTGLCVSLLEEAAIDGIPALVIDPKGDLANLLLTFPHLEGRDFEPWVNADEARNQGLTTGQFAEAEAAKWRAGLAEWRQDGERIQRLRAACEFAVYTPGSNAGLPVSILKSFAAPGAAVLNDREALRERVATTATSLLSLAGIDGDPTQSREHILLSTILDTAWRDGQDLDLAAVIGQVQRPPFEKVGVLDLDSFYPQKERFGLVLALNNLLASPGFEAWMQGEALDVDAMLWTAEGRPRIAIFSIAHLSDAERMFFVSLLLNQTLAWMRGQSGTSSLRALLYMDEIFGYFPPVANPPSKRPLLTLLKQARAFGLGVVLATQNPVDLDYKGLANTGTWFIGRLQTERDKARVLEGLEGAATASGAAFDRGAMERLLAGLGKRVFLLNNVHEDAPVTFETRWTLSYLRGPMARPEIERLMAGAARAETSVEVAEPGAVAPVLAAEIPQLFVPLTGAVLAYEPRLIGAARVSFNDPKLGVAESRDCVFACPITEAAVPVDWTQAEELETPLDTLEKTPTEGATFADLPAVATKAKNYAVWQRSFATWVFQTQTLELLRSPSTGAVSRLGETERDFRLRTQQAAREARDEQIEKLRRQYAPKFAAAENQLQRAQVKVEQEKAQAQAQTLSSVVSIGASLLGAFMGRKTISAANLNRVGTAVRAGARISKERGDIGLAEGTVEQAQGRLAALQQQFESDVAKIPEAEQEQFDRIMMKPKKTGIEIQLVALGWM